MAEPRNAEPRKPDADVKTPKPEDPARPRAAPHEADKESERPEQADTPGQDGDVYGR